MPVLLLQGHTENHQLRLSIWFLNPSPAKCANVGTKVTNGLAFPYCIMGDLLLNAPLASCTLATFCTLSLRVCLLLPTNDIELAMNLH